MFKKNKIIFKILLSLTVLALPSFAFGATCQLPPAQTASAWINCIVNNVLSLVLWPVFLTAVVVVGLWIGFMYLTAKGEPAKITQATTALVWLIVGVVVALLAFSLVETIKNLIGVT